MESDTYKKIRNEIINLVLATDMSFHFTNLAKLKEKISKATSFDPISDKKLCLENTFHLADIFYPTRPYEIFREWGERCLQEFFLQVIKIIFL